MARRRYDNGEEESRNLEVYLMIYWALVIITHTLGSDMGIDKAGPVLKDNPSTIGVPAWSVYLPT
jgi:hypothetical protein